MDISYDINDKYVNLSFESYLEESVECFKSIAITSKKIEKNEEDFYQNVVLLKKMYQTRSTEDEKTTDKKTFADKTRDFFLKMWTFIVSIFSKILEIVVSLIKSLIIFIQKKRVQMNSIFKLFEKDSGLKGFNNTHKDILIKMLTEDKEIKTFSAGNSPYNHTKIYDLLKRKSIENFVKLKIKSSRTSQLSVEYLQKQFENHKKIAVDNKLLRDEGRKLNEIEESVDELYAAGVLYNEPNSDGGSAKVFAESNRETIYELLNTSKIDALAHMLVFDKKDKSYDKITLKEYFKGGSDGNKNVNWAIMEKMFKEYYEISDMLLGKNKYIESLEAQLKDYKEMCSKDNKIISQLNKDVISEINKYIDQETPEAKSRLSNYKKITSIFLKVKNIKSHFIRLRQQVIIDLMSLYSIENNAWWSLVKNGKLLKGNEYKEEDPNVSQFNIIKRPE